jgi:glutathione S-transferase
VQRVELYDHPFSPFSFKVRAALYEKGVAFEKCEIRRHDQREALLRLNPRGEVPALVDGDTVLADSKVICAYLEERFPEPALLPAELSLRARCRSLELVSDTEVDACVVVLGTLQLFRPELARQVPEALPRAEAVLAAHYAYLERELGDRDWFVGDFSLADIALAPHLRSAAFMGHPPGAKHPALSRWLERVSERPSVRQAVREMAEGYAAARSDPDSIFDAKRLHWRNDRIECALRCGLGPWLVEELEADRAFLSPVPS